jgi:hypothetical protein
MKNEGYRVGIVHSKRDKSDNDENSAFAQDFIWDYGEKYVIVRNENLGLKKHIFECGLLTKYFKAIILLEDDLFVSPDFYDFTNQCIEEYGSSNSIAGISLYRYERNPFARGAQMDFIKNNSDVFLMQVVSSWGQCWTERMWNEFMDWYDTQENFNIANYNLPENIKKWNRAWTPFYYGYMLDTAKYFLYPSISYSTNFSSAGEHNHMKDDPSFQVNLSFGKTVFVTPKIANLERYDVFGNNEDIYKIVDIPKNDLCVDLYGNNPNIRNKKYYLTIRKLDYLIVKSFGLKLRPPELNIQYSIEGSSIYLFDTKTYKTRKKEQTPDYSLHSYFYNIDNKMMFLWSYVIKKTIHYISSKLKK